MTSQRNRSRVGAAGIAFVLAAVGVSGFPAWAQVSDGSDGAFHPGANVSFNLNSVHTDGVFNFTTITIDAGRTVSFTPNSASNVPVLFLATGDVVINGTLTVSASNTGGPGGGRGGTAGVNFTDGGDGSGPSPGQGGAKGSTNPGHAGGGGGMATAGRTAIRWTAAPPAPGGDAIAYPSPITGGSGGGGGGGWQLFGVNLSGGGGGHGGGGILIATLGNLTIGPNGRVLANGTDGGTAFSNAFGNGGPGGGGSGGLIELRGDAVTLACGGQLLARGGRGGGVSKRSIHAPDFSSGAHGGDGFIRFVGGQTEIFGTVDPPPMLGSLDPFLCYRAKTTRKTPKFERIAGLHLGDQFEDRGFDVKAIERLCAPADQNGEGISDPDTHLEGYKIKQTEREPKFLPRAGIRIVNRFHPSDAALVVDVQKAVSLLVPTAKDPDAPVPNPPNPAEHEVDHFKCYAVKANKSSRFDPILGVEIEDQFTGGPRTYDLKKPTRLCVPVDKAGEGIGDSLTHLQCYLAKPAKGLCSVDAPENAGAACAKETNCGGIRGETTFCEAQSKHERTSVWVNNQFGPGRVDAVKEIEFCVPSVKILSCE